jgi:5-formyltetrahydrofolate cyclo-ligase
MTQDITEHKRRLRREMLAARRALPGAFVAANSELICGQLRDWPPYRAAKTIMLYLAMPDEPQTDGLISDALARGKTVCVPLLHQAYGQMDAAAIDGFEALTVGRLGLKMPDPAKAVSVDPATIELVVVPGVAFDRRGGRLGMGAGYYDRFLPRLGQAMLVGLAWSCQVIDAVPCDEHDVAMHYLLTEGGFMPCSGGKM